MIVVSAFAMWFFIIITVILLILYVRAIIQLDKEIRKNKQLNSDLNHKRSQYRDLMKHTQEVDKDYADLLVDLRETREDLRETRKQSAMHWKLKK